MKYLCLACGDGSTWDGLTEVEQRSYVDRCRVHDEKLAADDLDEAVEIASMHPAARMGAELGWYVAVRPLFTPEASS